MPAAHPFRHRLAVLAVPPLVLGLAACGSDGDDADDADDAPSSTVTVTETAEETTSPTPESGGSGGTDDGALEAAAATALDELSGATLVAIDRDGDDDGDWEVTLVAQDGRESDVEVAPDGGSVTRGPDSDDDDDDDDDDRADNRRLLEAQVGYLDAIATARAEVSGLEVTGADLEEDDGRLEWDVDLGDGSDDDQRTVRVDARSGEVLGTDRDDDGDDDGDDRDGDDDD